MHNRLFLISLLLTTINLFSQNGTIKIQKADQGTKQIIKKFGSSQQISESYYILVSDRKTKHGEYIYYFQIKNRNLILEGHIKRKGNYNNGKKNGHWVEYSSPGVIMTEGDYANDKKIGIWVTVQDQGKIYERFDYDNNKKLSPIITRLNIKYPESAKESGVEGVVTVTYKINSDCSMSEIFVAKGLSPHIDKAAIDAVKQMGLIYKQYFMCEDQVETQMINFTLR